MSWMLSLYKKSGSETSNTASVKKAQATSLRRFWSRKVKYCCPRAGFCGRTKTQTLPVPHSGTLGSKGIITIYQHSYSPNTATVEIFLFQRGEVEAGWPLAVPGQPHDELRGGVRTSSKIESARPFGGGWTAANSTSESALSWLLYHWCCGWHRIFVPSEIVLVRSSKKV
jgi:hypothetical protein